MPTYIINALFMSLLFLLQESKTNYFLLTPTCLKNLILIKRNIKFKQVGDFKNLLVESNEEPNIERETNADIKLHPERVKGERLKGTVA